MSQRGLAVLSTPRIASSLEDFREHPVSHRLKRYMTLEKFFDLVANEHLTFSRLSELEDRSEGYEAPAVLKVDAEAFFEDLYSKGAERDIVDALISSLSSCATYTDLLSVITLAKKISVSAGYTAEFIYETNAISQRVAFPVSRRWFCLCFTHKEAEDYLLWSAYTRGRLGVCVEFCPRQLAIQLTNVGYAAGNEEYTEYFSEILLGSVKYIPSLMGNPSTQEEDYVFTKSEHFSGEKEFRVAGRVNQFGISSNTFQIKISNLSELIKGVSISPFYSAWEAEAVRASIQAVWEKTQDKPIQLSLSNVTKPTD